ncbi:MAG TPA: beta-ketoacyl synthase N-terminal-like domain-containing protein, partial [Pseudonocardiaceae bacterium]
MGAGTQVVITGMGVVAPGGVGLDEFHEAQLAARSAVRRVPELERVPGLVSIAAPVELPPALRMDRREALRTDRCVQLASAAAGLAVEHAKLDLEDVDRSRVGVLIGTGAGGMGASEESLRTMVADGAPAVRARTIPMLMLNAPAAHVAIRFGLTGPCASVATACASGGDSIIAAVQAIRSGEADVMLAGGTEAPITPFVMASFGALGALAGDARGPEAASRPFDAGRTGFVMAEGSGVLVLESAEHAAARG